MAEQKKQSKKLPKRTSRPQHKLYRASCWAKQKARKAERRAAQAQRAYANATGRTKPWDIAKRERYARRHSQ